VKAEEALERGKVLALEIAQEEWQYDSIEIAKEHDAAPGALKRVEEVVGKIILGGGGEIVGEGMSFWTEVGSEVEAELLR